MLALQQQSQNAQSLTLDKKLLEITWLDAHLDTLKDKVWNSSALNNLKKTEPNFKSVFDSLFDPSKTHRQTLLDELNQGFNIFSDPEDAIVKALIQTFDWVKRRPSAQDPDKLIDDFKASIRQKLPSVDFTQFDFDSIKAGLQKTVIDQGLQDILNEFFAFLKIEQARQFPTPFDLQKFLNETTDVVQADIDSWFLQNKFTSSVFPNLKSRFLDLHGSFYTNFLRENIQKAIRDNGTSLPTIDKDNFEQTFKNNIYKEFDNSNSDIFKKLEATIYSELDNELNQIDHNFLLDIIEKNNIVLNSQYENWKTSQKTTEEIIEDELNAKLKIAHFRFKVEQINILSKGDWVERELKFTLEDSRFQKDTANIKKSGSIKFHLVNGELFLQKAKERFEKFKVEPNIPSLAIGNLNNFLFVPFFNNLTWNQEWGSEEIRIKGLNLSLDLKIDNLRDYNDHIELDISIYLNGSKQQGITISIEKKERFDFMEKQEEESMGKWLEQEHKDYEKHFEDIIPSSLKDTEKVKEIQQRFLDDSDQLLQSQIKEMQDVLDPSSIQSQSDLLKTIEDLKFKFTSELQELIEKARKELSELELPKKIVNEFNDVLDTDISLDKELLDKIIENPEVYEKLADSPLMKEKESLERILQLMKDNPDFFNLIADSTNLDQVLNGLDFASGTYKWIYFGAGAFLGTTGLTGVALSARSFSVNKKLSTLKNSKIKKSSLKTASLFTIFTSFVAIGASIVLMLIFFLSQGGFSG